MWCSIATMDARHSTMAKCVTTHPMVAPALTEVLLALPHEDTSQVTGDYGFLPIPTPSTMGDEARFHAITVQTEFSRQLISTQISGLPPTDWFTPPTPPVPPQLVPPSHPPNPTWADIIVRGSFTHDDHTSTPSLIIKLSTDASCTHCYLTAHKADAEALVRHTRLLFITLSSWAGDDYPLTCHVSSAQVLLCHANYTSHTLLGTGHDTLLRTTADTLHAKYGNCGTSFSLSHKKLAIWHPDRIHPTELRTNLSSYWKTWHHLSQALLRLPYPWHLVLLQLNANNSSPHKRPYWLLSSMITRHS